MKLPPEEHNLPDPPRVSPSYQNGDFSPNKKGYQHGDGLSQSLPASSDTYAQLMQLKRENEELKQRQGQFDHISRTAPAADKDMQMRLDQLTRENQMLKGKIR